ncbi:MAG: nucleoside deaminase [Psychroflexus sp.]|jgi:tRNA(adenine34) deaminase|nr:nucleoside deaminase [Psychroflexus sp.]MDR9448127.1 nucleoside deaminase [Psychroflexus sp.]
MLELESDYFYMERALAQGKLAGERGEVPVGAVIVSDDNIIAKAHNLTEQLTDVTAHAEMQAITAASHYLGSKYLKNCRLFVSLEPCAMCAGALYWAQIGEINFAASDPKRGYRALQATLHPKTKVNHGILEDQALYLLQSFFQSKRN